MTLFKGGKPALHCESVCVPLSDKDMANCKPRCLCQIMVRIQFAMFRESNDWQLLQ